MQPLRERLFICGFDERVQFQSHRISHLITVANPGADLPRLTWFHGAHLELRFGDVTSEADAERWRTTAPSLTDIQRAVSFFRDACATPDSRILVTCDYGASRSPGLAYVFAADQFGSGREAEALGLTLEIRPVAVPNGLVVRLGDTVLERRGALISPLRSLYAKINAELFPKQA